MINRPLKFRPYYKTVLWGGDKIGKYKGEKIDLDNVGESWEISVVAGHESEVVDDELGGRNLNQLVKEYGAELIGDEVCHRCGDGFPLLIKIIDAQADLSVQVHPGDELARERHGQPGKSEMWYIIDRTPGARIYTGLRAPLSRDEYRRRVADNSIMDVVGAHPSEPGQFYFVPAGTLHAIGAGNLLVEVQQSSDITYRVYDYDRRDASGNARELHTEMAEQAINYTFPNEITPTAKVYDKTTPNVIDCEYFNVSLLKQADGEVCTIDNEGRTFTIVIVTEGALALTASDGKTYTCAHGETMFLPASMQRCTLSGSATALLVTA